MQVLGKRKRSTDGDGDFRYELLSGSIKVQLRRCEYTIGMRQAAVLHNKSQVSLMSDITDKHGRL